MGKSTLAYKSPNEEVDYQIVWSSTLGTDTIFSSLFTNVSSGVTLTTFYNTSTYCVIWFSGGTSGNSYEFTNQIETTGGRIYEKTLRFEVWDK